MVAEAEVIVCPKSLPVLEVPYYSKETRLEEIESINGGISTLDRVRASEPVSSSSQSVCSSSSSSSYR